MPTTWLRSMSRVTALNELSHGGCLELRLLSLILPPTNSTDTSVISWTRTPLLCAASEAEISSKSLSLSDGGIVGVHSLTTRQQRHQHSFLPASASGSKKRHYQAFGAFWKPGIHVNEPPKKGFRVSLVELPQWRKKTCLESRTAEVH